MDLTSTATAALTTQEQAERAAFLARRSQLETHDRNRLVALFSELLGIQVAPNEILQFQQRLMRRHAVCVDGHRLCLRVFRNRFDLEVLAPFYLDPQNRPHPLRVEEGQQILSMADLGRVLSPQARHPVVDLGVHYRPGAGLV